MREVAEVNVGRCCWGGLSATHADNGDLATGVFCQVLVGHVAGFFPASWLLHEGVGYSPGFALVA